MFWISDRVVPAIAFANRPPERAVTLMLPSAWLTSTSGRIGNDSEPFGPFTVTIPGATSAVTLLPRETGRFATLDILLNRWVQGPAPPSARYETMHSTSPPWPSARA